MTESPLADIEAAVQARAKDRNLDLSHADGVESLRTLIADEIARWSADAKRGLRPYDLADADEVADRAFRNLAGYGPLEPLLSDPDVWEIAINAPEAALSSPASRIERRSSCGYLTLSR